jgi:SulP family sulfate permease
MALLRQANGKVLVTLLHGSFSYASARELARRAEPIAGHKVAVYDFSQVGYIDTSAALAIEEIVTLATSRGLRVLISGLQGSAKIALAGLRVLEKITPDQVFTERKAAIEAAVAIAEEAR